MNAQQIKEYIYENHKIEEVLSEIGCHDIKYHSSGYYTVANKGGDNKQAITIYVPSLNVVNYTRTLDKPSDLITLVEFNLEINFFKALKWLHEFLGLDFYLDHEPNLPLSLILTRELQTLEKGNSQEYEDDTPIKVLDEKVLKYYKTPCVNEMFSRDGISYETQVGFSLGYDAETNRITIPIYSEIGDLISVKARLFKEHVGEDELKYIYLYKCPRNKILFGLNRTIDHIKEKGKCVITESEKGVLQLWSYGYKYSTGIGGKQVSKTQIDKLSRLNVDLIFAFDQDVKRQELEALADRFMDGVNVYYLYDEDGLLKPKESPSDRKEIFEYMMKNNIYKIK